MLTGAVHAELLSQSPSARFPRGSGLTISPSFQREQLTLLPTRSLVSSLQRSWENLTAQPVVTGVQERRLNGSMAPRICFESRLAIFTRPGTEIKILSRFTPRLISNRTMLGNTYGPLSIELKASYRMMEVWVEVIGQRLCAIFSRSTSWTIMLLQEKHGLSWGPIRSIICKQFI